MPFISLKQYQPERKGLYKVQVKRKDGSINEFLGDWTGTDFRPYNWDWQRGDEITAWFKQ